MEPYTTITWWMPEGMDMKGDKRKHNAQLVTTATTHLSNLIQWIPEEDLSAVYTPYFENMMVPASELAALLAMKPKPFKLTVSFAF